ncbi:hypothetical protein [Hydrogenophilus thermoluteolus]|mgnify:CR=1 FL=1|uniref:hypothetical protein n=1 Tax=Hydrogenophilus thermoluteolus TaxID=297 RepID=UPI0011AE3689|nr:hypothetical protein [Hydrogenophilus thermoluteolus]
MTALVVALLGKDLTLAQLSKRSANMLSTFGKSATSETSTVALPTLHRSDVTLRQFLEQIGPVRDQLSGLLGSVLADSGGNTDRPYPGLVQRIPLLHQIVAPAFRSSPKWCSTVLIAVRRRCPFLSFQFFV